jgi:peptidoglycan/LPS O-acetylase OafA/YrhL
MRLSKLLKLNIEPSRVYGLDILRAVAILLVVLQHGIFLLPEKIQQSTQIIEFDGVSIFLC